MVGSMINLDASSIIRCMCWNMDHSAVDCSCSEESLPIWDLVRIERNQNYFPLYDVHMGWELTLVDF